MASSDRTIRAQRLDGQEWAVAKRAEFSAARPNFDSVCSTGVSDQQRVSSRCKWEASRRSIRKFVVSTQGPLDPRAPRAETDAVGRPRAVVMLLNQLANGPGRVAEHHGRGPRYASSRLPSFRLLGFRLLGRGVFRPLSTARS